MSRMGGNWKAHVPNCCVSGAPHAVSFRSWLGKRSVVLLFRRYVMRPWFRSVREVLLLDDALGEACQEGRIEQQVVITSYDDDMSVRQRIKPGELLL
jgi:hypothetical protein